MRSDPTRLQLSLYAFPDELHVDELWLHAPGDEDVDRIAPAFRDPAVGGEAGLPPVGASELRVMMREMLPGMRLAGMLSPYVIEDSRASDLLGGLTLHHFDSMRDSVEVGFWLFREARGRGVATRGRPRRGGARAGERDHRLRHSRPAGCGRGAGRHQQSDRAIAAGGLRSYLPGEG